MTTARSIRVWDWPVRLCHWALVLTIAALYATGEYGWLDMDWHFRFGYLALALVLFRLIWGVIGSEHARFTDFVRGPSTILAYFNNWRGADLASQYPGHNPLGALSVLALLALLLVQALTGLFSNDQIQWYGPLAERISQGASDTATSWHKLGQKVLLALIALHLLAIAGHRVLRREILVAPMLHGRKVSAVADDARWRSPILALVVFAACLALVWAISVYGPVPLG